MATYSWWISFAGVFCTCIALALTSAGLAEPWWTAEIPDGTYPVWTRTTLWISSTTTYQASDERSHIGCTGICDKTRVGRIRIVSSCTAWGDLCSAAQFSCKMPMDSSGATASGSAASGSSGSGGAVATTPAEAYYWNPTEPPRPSAPAPSTGGGSSLRQPTVPPPELPIEASLTTTVLSTSTRSSTLTTTSTPFTTRTTAPLTPVPGTTRAILRRNEFPAKTAEEFMAGEYTPWELAFELRYQVNAAIYLSLNRALADIPYKLFWQRPTTAEQVRLIWEAFVERSAYPEWLSQYNKDFCPSAPAERLHAWLYQPENKWTRSLVLQALEPPDIKPASWTDAGVREAWEKQVGGLPTTAKPLWERDDGSIYGGIYITTTTLWEGTMQPSIPLPAFETSEDRFQQPPSMSVASCQKARSDGGTDVPEWHEEMGACDVVPMCTKIWAVRAGLILQLVLGLGSAMPSCLSFIGSNGVFASRFPPIVEACCAGGSALGLFISLLIASFIGMPKGSPMVLNGAGFACTVVALLFCAASAGLAMLAKGAAAAEEVVRIDADDEAPKAVVLKHQREFPARPPAIAADSEAAAPGSGPSMLAWEEPPPPPRQL